VTRDKMGPGLIREITGASFTSSSYGAVMLTENTNHRISHMSWFCVVEQNVAFPSFKTMILHVINIIVNSPPIHKCKV
jgi:hypothetical protein